MPGEVSHAREALTAWAPQAGVPTMVMDDVRLALTEALANATLHAYAGTDGGRMRVRARVAEGILLLQVDDDGRGPEGRSPNAGLGMGLEIMRRVSDESDVRRCPGHPGTCVTLRFRLPEAS